MLPFQTYQLNRKKKKPAEKCQRGTKNFKLVSASGPSGAFFRVRKPRAELPPTCRYAPALDAQQQQVPAFSQAKLGFRLRVQTSSSSVRCSNRCTPGRPVAP